MRPRTTCFVFATCILAVVCLGAGAPAAPADFEKAQTEARVALDLGHFDEAQKLFDKLAAAYPQYTPKLSFDHAWPYVEKGYSALQRKDYAEADRLLTRAVEIHPDLRDSLRAMCAYARMWAISPVLDAAYGNPKAADWGKVEAALKGLLVIDAKSPWAHYRLGHALERRGKRDEALREYKAAVGAGKGAPRAFEALKDAAEKASDSYKYQYKAPVYPLLSRVDYAELKKYEEAPFVIFHHNEELARRAAAVLKDSLSREVLGGILQARTTLPQVCVVTIYRDKDEYAGGSGMKNFGGVTQNAFEYEGETVSAISVRQDQPDVLSHTLGHELGHVRYFAEHQSQGGEASWLTEGIAENAAHGPPGAEVAVVLENARKSGKLLSGEDLLSIYSGDRRMVDMVYPQGHVLTSLLVEKYGAPKLQQFIEAVGEYRITSAVSLELATAAMKKTQIEKMQKVYGLTPADVDRLILDWISANLPKDAGRTPGED